MSASLLLLMMVASPARADTTFTVKSSADTDGTTCGASDCTLRQAINAANAAPGNDTIVFDLGQTATITLGSTLPKITDAGGLTIDGQSASITISGNQAVRVFGVSSGALTLNNLTVADGVSSGGANGGGIYNLSGTITVTNSTFSNNSAGFGGGIFNDSGGTLTVSNSTLSNNSADQGEGIYSFGRMATLSNTIVANSTPGETGENCFGNITDGGYNISSDGSCTLTAPTSKKNTDPMLGTLADNGGPTKTMALQEGSPAIDKGATTLTTDQRGVSRPQRVAADIGAFELEVSNSAPTAKDDPTNAGDPKYSVDEDGSLTVSASDGVLANDTDPEEDPLTAIKVTDPTNGTLTLNSSDGSFTYTPKAGFSGTDSFTYKANDGTNDSNVATVSITVNPETTAPTVTSVTPTKTTGVSRTPNITATFSEQMDKATVEEIDPSTQQSVNVKLINRANGNQVAATVSCDADSCNKVTITPENALKANTKYRAIVNTGVEDLAGNRLDQDPTTTGNQREVWTFTTRR